MKKSASNKLNKPINELHQEINKFRTKGKKSAEQNNDIILSVKNLSVFYKNKNSFFFKNKKDYFQAVKNLSFEISKGETLGIVGESGSGKSSVAQALIKLISSEGNFFF